MDKFLERAHLEEIRNIKRNIENGLPEVVRIVADILKPYTDFLNDLKPKIEQYRPALEKLAETSAIMSAIDKLGGNQYVLWKPLPRDFVVAMKTAKSPELIDKLIEQYIEVDDIGTIDFCKSYLDGNAIFDEAVIAFRQGLYNVAIVSFVVILDRVIAECSGLIRRMKFQDRIDRIEQMIDQKGDQFFEELDAGDYLVFLTYFDAIKGIGDGSSFDKEEPTRLSRPWLAHGRTQRQYARIDCIKIINMIYGTIRMSVLGKEDTIDR